MPASMGLTPTTHAGYPSDDTPEKRRAHEEFSIAWCLRREGITACVGIEEDGSLTVRVMQCLDPECRNVRHLVLKILSAADPERSRQGRIAVEVDGATGQD